MQKSSPSINVNSSIGFMQLQWCKSKVCLLVIFFYFDLLSGLDTEFNFILTVIQAESCLWIECHIDIMTSDGVPVVWNIFGRSYAFGSVTVSIFVSIASERNFGEQFLHLYLVEGRPTVRFSCGNSQNILTVSVNQSISKDIPIPITIR